MLLNCGGPERSNGLDCKSSGLGLREFESLSAHFFNKIYLILFSYLKYFLYICKQQGISQQILFCIYKDKDKKEMEVEISTFAKENTAMYKIPRIYEFVDELPKTHSGKIRRIEIRQNDAKKTQS